MSDTTQRQCTNHIVRFRSFLVYILYGFLKTENVNNWGQVLVCCMQLIGHAARLGLLYFISVKNSKYQL